MVEVRCRVRDSAAPRGATFDRKLLSRWRKKYYIYGYFVRLDRGSLEFERRCDVVGSCQRSHLSAKTDLESLQKDPEVNQVPARDLAFGVHTTD
jgi:hypothetical protein